jgi:hypothetical protein
MRASYKFFKHKNGISAFAEVGIESAPSPDFAVTWAKDVATYERNYGNAVREGITQALRWHRDLGGGPAKFTISDFVELIVDTREDAVRCASAAAAWMALGHSETELAFDFEGTWHVSKPAI